MKIFHHSIHHILLVAMLLTVAGVNPVLAAPSYAPDAGTIRVAPTGTDFTGCGSASLPCKTIQYAINQAVNGDMLKVAAGTYTYDATVKACSFLITPAVACVNNKTVTIIGGYTSADWNTYNPVQNLTVIDGQGQRRGVAVISLSNQRTVLTMKGFTVQNGRAYGKSTNPDDYTRHAFGAGIYSSHGLLELEDLVVINNAAYGTSNTSLSIGGWAFGGGISVEGTIYGGGTTTLQNVILENNQAVGGVGKNGGGNGLGGGLMTNAAELIATNLTITNNLAQGGNTAGNGCDGSGSGYGGAASLGNNPNIVLNHMIATNNQAKGGNATGSASCGGHGIGAGLFLESSNVTINDSDLDFNQATGGVGKTGGIGWAGGIYTEKVNLTLDRDKLLANSAQSGGSSGGGQAGQAGGGGAYISAYDNADYYSSITNSLFADNKATMGAPGTKSTGGGGGLVIQAVKVDITHSSFVNNQLENGLSLGQAILVLALNGTSGKAGQANIKYSLITDHKNNLSEDNSALTVFQGNSASLSYDWFGNNTSDYSVPLGTPLDHVWKDTRSGSYVSPSSPDYDYHLKADSPAINQAVGSTLTIDLDCLPRPVSGVADLGPYEFRLPDLVVDRSSISAITDLNQIITIMVHVSVSEDTIVNWIAEADADWVYLGAAGSSQEGSGVTGTDLVIRLDSSKVNLGTHSATITVSSLSANPTTISVELTKMENLEKIYIPLAQRQ